MSEYNQNNVNLSIKKLLEHISYHFDFEENFLHDISYLELNEHKNKNKMKAKWRPNDVQNVQVEFYPPAKHLILLRFFLCRK